MKRSSNVITLTTALLLLLSTFPTVDRAADAAESAFARLQVSDKYYTEGAGYGDFNHDDILDVVAGPFWYAGPEFKQKHRFYDGKEFPNDRGYSDNFFSFGHDVNGDEWTDIVVIGFPGLPAYWFENPQNKSGNWPRHLALPGVENESPTFLDITGDGRPEIVCSYQGHLGYGQYDPENPTAPWSWHKVSDRGPWTPFTHGLGVGDVNGDGRQDLLTALGWLEQPESLEGDPVWTAHVHRFCPGGAQMFAYDVDGDGDNDVISSLQAHAYGLSWFEQVKQETGEITFTPHVIMGADPDTAPYDVAFSQLHAVALRDMDGDGLLDIVTGKCYWAHNGHDPGARDPAVIYCFHLVRDDAGKVTFRPAVIDDDSGVGRQISLVDMNNDGTLDVVVANKKGIFVFHQKKR